MSRFDDAENLSWAPLYWVFLKPKTIEISYCLNLNALPLNTGVTVILTTVQYPSNQQYLHARQNKLNSRVHVQNANKFAFLFNLSIIRKFR